MNQIKKSIETEKNKQVFVLGRYASFFDMVFGSFFHYHSAN